MFLMKTGLDCPPTGGPVCTAAVNVIVPRAFLYLPVPLVIRAEPAKLPGATTWPLSENLIVPSG